ncbi:MAG: hypothetical protein PWR23_762 [Peptostreptococcaceae bacterium]|nr:hypothetical protein [Peptostreptococcaceae bacterium]
MKQSNIKILNLCGINLQKEQYRAINSVSALFYVSIFYNLNV